MRRVNQNILEPNFPFFESFGENLKNNLRKEATYDTNMRKAVAANFIFIVLVLLIAYATIKLARYNPQKGAASSNLPDPTVRRVTAKSRTRSVVHTAEGTMDE
eukprot:Trichotokara_eunicae@DN769_c0_g1_i1.p2